MSSTKRVVIIGNGAAGSQLAAKLAKSKQCNVTVITPFNYSEISVNMTKSIAVGADEYMKSVFPLLKEDKVEYVIDKCVSLTSSSVVLDSERTIEFDVCIVATGQNIPVFFPDVNSTNFSERKKVVCDVSDRIKSASSVVVGGGGAIGTELAADIKLRNKDKRVVLVHPHVALLPGMHSPFQVIATDRMRAMGIELILSDRVVGFENNEAVLLSGRRIPCDIYLPAFPLGGNSTFLPKVCTDEKGYVKVDDCFRVQLLNNVFAFGDCCDFDRAKTYPKIYDQMATVRHNVLAALENKPLRHHVRHASFMGRLEGPLMVALGHDLDDGYGVGPDCPGLLGSLCWLGCFLSWPCTYPAGRLVNTAKSEFNASIRPRKGKGFSG